VRIAFRGRKKNHHDGRRGAARRGAARRGCGDDGGQGVERIMAKTGDRETGGPRAFGSRERGRERERERERTGRRQIERARGRRTETERER